MASILLLLLWLGVAAIVGQAVHVSIDSENEAVHALHVRAPPESEDLMRRSGISKADLKDVTGNGELDDMRHLALEWTDEKKDHNSLQRLQSDMEEKYSLERYVIEAANDICTIKIYESSESGSSLVGTAFTHQCVEHVLTMYNSEDAKEKRVSSTLSYTGSPEECVEWQSKLKEINEIGDTEEERVNIRKAKLTRSIKETAGNVQEAMAWSTAWNVVAAVNGAIPFLGGVGAAIGKTVAAVAANEVKLAGMKIAGKRQEILEQLLDRNYASTKENREVILGEFTQLKDRTRWDQMITVLLELESVLNKMKTRMVLYGKVAAEQSDDMQADAHAKLVKEAVEDAVIAYADIEDVIKLYNMKVDKCKLDADAVGFLQRKLIVLKSTWASLKDSTALVLNNMNAQGNTPQGLDLKSLDANGNNLPQGADGSSVSDLVSTIQVALARFTETIQSALTKAGGTPAMSQVGHDAY